MARDTDSYAANWTSTAILTKKRTWSEMASALLRYWPPSCYRDYSGKLSTSWREGQHVVHCSKKSESASSPATTGSVFMRRFRLLLEQCGKELLAGNPLAILKIRPSRLYICCHRAVNGYKECTLKLLSSLHRGNEYCTVFVNAKWDLYCFHCTGVHAGH